MSSKTVQKRGRNRRTNWKDIQSRRQIAKKSRLALIILALVLGVLIFGRGVKFIQSLFTPWQGSLTSQRKFSWNGDFNLNVLIRAKGVSLFSYNPNNQKITLVDIPPNTYLEVAHGFGKWGINSIYQLGESQNIGGGNLLKSSLANFFGLPIDGFIYFSAKYSQKEASSIIAEIRKNPFSAIGILPEFKTDLTPFELIRLKLGLSSVRFDKIKEINLEEMDLMLEEKLADGTEILTADEIKLDSALSELKDWTVSSEHKTIAVFNSTDRPLLAQKAARLITNIGGDVIIVANGKNKFGETKISGEESKTLHRLKQIFEASDTISPSDEDLVSSRAQINIFLGEDSFDRL